MGRKYPLIPLPSLLLSAVPPPGGQMVSKPPLPPAWPWPCTCSSQEGSLKCSLLESCLGLGVGVTGG